MIWAILIFLGVPLWICAAGISITVLKNRGLRKRPGDIPVRVRAPGKTRWARGHAIWVSDVFAWRRSPASWNEALVHVTDVSVRDAEEQYGLRRLGDKVRIATLTSADGGSVDVAASAADAAVLVGPFEHTASPASSATELPATPSRTTTE